MLQNVGPGIKGSVIKGSKKGSSELVFLPEALQSLQPRRGSQDRRLPRRCLTQSSLKEPFVEKKDPLLMARQNNK